MSSIHSKTNTSYLKEYYGKAAASNRSIKENFEPLFVSNNPKISQLIQKEFKLIAVNVSDLRDANIICLGERHLNDQHGRNNAEVIDALCDENDLILAEEEEDGYGWESQAKHVKFSLPVKGWDKLDEKTLKGLHTMYTKLVPLEFFQGLAINIGIFFEEVARWKFAIKIPYLAYIPISCIGLYGCYKLSKGVRKISALVRIFEDTKDSSLKRLEYLMDFMQTEESSQLLMKGLPVRNTHMAQKIEENLPLNRRIYVIAGSAHFQPSGCDNCSNKIHIYQNEGYKIILDCLRKQKFAILVPKKA